MAATTVSIAGPSTGGDSASAASAPVGPPASVLERLGSVAELQEAVPDILADLRGRSPSVEGSRGLSESLRSELALLLGHRPHVCFLGKTGSGKTSLMNAIIGRELLPAEDTGVAVTSSVTEIAHDPALPEDRVVATSSLCTRDDWAEKKRLLIGALAGDLEDSGSFAEDEMQQVARTLLAAACPGMSPEQVELTTPESDDFLQRLTDGRQQPRSLTFEKSSDVRAWLRDRVHLAQSTDMVESVLTAKVRLTGNFSRIPRDVTLVDLPGLEDSNLLRSSVAERYFALFCTHAWFCLPRAEGRILSNRGIARQVRTLARGGNLGNVLVIRTRADEAARKTAKILDREHEDFKKLCRTELDFLVAGRPSPGTAAEPAADRSGDSVEDQEPPRSRRRIMEASEAGSAAPSTSTGDERPSSVSFGGYVLATVAPAVDDMPAEISIDPVVGKLQAVADDQRGQAQALVRGLYQGLEELLRREQEAARARREEEERRRRQAEEELRKVEEALRRAEEERQQRVREMVRQRTQVRSQFQAVVDVCKAKVHQFCVALRASSTREVNTALLSELRRAKPPNGRTLHALVVSGGVYTSPTRGDFDLPETFTSSTRVFGRDLPSAFSHLLDTITTELNAAQANLSVDLSQVMTLQLRTVRQQINATATRGGPIHNLCARALHWPGGKGASVECIDYAERVFERSTGPLVQQIAELLGRSVDEFLDSLRQRVAARIGIFEPESSSGRQEIATCVICQDAPAVARANFVVCMCSPCPPYACHACVSLIDLQLRRCPMCRGRG